MRFSFFSILLLICWSYNETRGYNFPTDTFPLAETTYGFDTTYIDVNENTTIHVQMRDGNNDNKKPILILHGGGDWMGTWLRVVPLLGYDRPIILLDHAGFGFSVGVSYYLMDHVNNIYFVLNHLGYTEGVEMILAHSMGTWIAWWFGSFYPSMVQKLVLIGSGTDVGYLDRYITESGYEQTLVNTYGEGIETGNFDTWYDLVTDTPEAALCPEWFLQNDAFGMIQSPIEVQDLALREFLANVTEQATEAIAPLVTADVLQIQGDNDTDVQNTEELGALFKNYEGIEWVPGVGHMVHWAEPELVAGKVLDFLNKGLDDDSSDESNLFGSAAGFTYAFLIGMFITIVVIFAAKRYSDAKYYAELKNQADARTGLNSQQRPSQSSRPYQRSSNSEYMQ